MAIQSHKKNAERAADAILVGGGAMAKAPAEALAAEGSLRGQKSVHHVSVLSESCSFGTDRATRHPLFFNLA